MQPELRHSSGEGGEIWAWFLSENSQQDIKKSHNPFYICWVFTLSDRCFRSPLRDRDKTQKPSPNVKWQDYGAGASAHYLQIQFLPAPCALQMFLNLQRRDWRGGPWCNSLGALAAAGRILCKGKWKISLQLNFVTSTSWELSLQQSCLLSTAHILL